MTREEAIEILNIIYCDWRTDEEKEAIELAIKALYQEPIKALGDDMRICQKSITDKKVLIGFNMAVAICNKHLTESEE